MTFNILSIVRSCFRHAKNKLGHLAFSSETYWQNRYAQGGNSGPGSYEHLAQFKADILNNFVAQNNVKTVIEFGCGDGNQLKLSNYSSYIGYDVSPEAISLCSKTFGSDTSKSFNLVKNYPGIQAELAMSLDVIFHLIEDDVFDQYMRKLFGASSRFVVIYSSNTDKNPSDTAIHVKHRTFTNWIEMYCPEWELISTIQNKYSYSGDYINTSFSNFYFFGRS